MEHCRLEQVSASFDRSILLAVRNPADLSTAAMDADYSNRFRDKWRFL